MTDIPHLVPVKVDAPLLDLDAYRKRREAAGTWPITDEEHLSFFREWKERKKVK